MTRYIIYLLLIVSHSATAQNNPKDYYAYRGNKKLIFIDDFDSDKDIWGADMGGETTGNSLDSTLFIEKGIYIYRLNRKESDRYAAAACKTEIDFSKNFEIEFKAKVISSSDNKHMGILFWGRKDSTLTGHYFYFQDKNTHHIFYCNSGIEGNIHPDINKSIHAKRIFNRKDYNLYTIRRHGKYYYIFINGMYSGKQKYIPLYGKYLGLGGNSNTTAIFDHIKVFYLP